MANAKRTDHDYYYLGEPYLGTLRGVCHALTETEAFVQLMGPAASGKSSLCEKLAQYLRRKGYRAINIDYAIESPELLRSLLVSEFDLPSSNNVARLLEDALLQDGQRPAVLIFDDAHLLSDVTLLEIYRLAEVQAGDKSVLHILLCGEPSLETRLLGREEFRSLSQHVTHSYALNPMSDKQSLDFLADYLAQAGADAIEMDSEASRFFLRSSQGYPESCLLLSRLLLERSVGRPNGEAINKAEMTRWTKQAGLAPSLPSSSVMDIDQLRVLTPAMAVIAVVLLGLAMRSLFFSEAANEGEADAVAETAGIDVTELPTQSADGSPNSVAATAADNPAARTGVATALEAEDSPFADATEPNQSTEAAQSSPSPSLLRPAPRLMLDEEPVTDSDLRLVTAEERGIRSEQLVAPEFEQLEPSGSDGRASVSDAAAEPATVFTDGDVARPEVFAELSGEAAELRNVVESWLDAWSSQRLDDYFASYHEDFEPRYDDSRQQWRSNRERVIGEAGQIVLRMSEFELLTEADASPATGAEVQFWLDYESSSYSDSTQKKLVLVPDDSGRWRILEEINLQVRGV